MLRRRITWYCGLVLGLLAFSFYGTSRNDIDISPLAAGAAAKIRALNFWYDLVMIGLYLPMLVYVLARRPSRARLVASLSLLTVLAAGVAMTFEILTTGLEQGKLGVASWPDNGGVQLALMALAAFVTLQLPASLLVPMRAKESVWIAGPSLVLYGIIIAVILRPFVHSWILLVVAFAIAALPGLLWSRWRYGEFDEHFRSQEMRGRFGELKSELAYARQIHEALFPPPVDDGPVRISYRYEPMREIGGDFLFVHPLSFPPSRPGGPLSVVLIDVSGHGVPAALAVNQLHGELRRFFSRSMHGSPGDPPPAAESPGALLTHLNRYAFEYLAPQAVYATAIALRADSSRGVIEWASAGHPPALLRTRDGRLEHLEATTTMLGVLEPEFFNADQQSLPFRHGDRVIAFTDGAHEARNERGEDFGLSRIRDLLIAVGAATTESPAEPLNGSLRVMEAVKAFRQSRTGDDILIVEIVRSAGESNGSRD